MAMHKSPALIALTAALAAAPAWAADGLTSPRPGDIWPQWQARLTVSSMTLAPVTLTTDPARSASASAALLSDYFFDTPGLRVPTLNGGLRATSGLVATPRALAPGPWAAAANDGSVDTVPYLGIGYTGLSADRAWGVTADLGLVAENPGGAGRVGRAIFGTSSQPWDGALREMRFSPLLQLGVRYAF
jgi:hypothetical protein